MKLFKHVVILSLVLVGLGSSAAFGECPNVKVNDNSITSSKTLPSSSSTQQKGSKTKSGTAD